MNNGLVSDVRHRLFCSCGLYLSIVFLIYYGNNILGPSRFMILVWLITLSDKVIFFCHVAPLIVFLLSCLLCGRLTQNVILPKIPATISSFACVIPSVDYASPSYGDEYSDRQLTLNFELWFCVPTYFHKLWGFQNLVCLSICPYPEKRNHHSFVNISPTLVIDTSMERSSGELQHGNQKFNWKFWIFFQKR